MQQNRTQMITNVKKELGRRSFICYQFMQMGERTAVLTLEVFDPDSMDMHEESFLINFKGIWVQLQKSQNHI